MKKRHPSRRDVDGPICELEWLTDRNGLTYAYDALFA